MKHPLALEQFNKRPHHDKVLVSLIVDQRNCLLFLEAAKVMGSGSSMSFRTPAFELPCAICQLCYLVQVLQPLCASVFFFFLMIFLSAYILFMYVCMYVCMYV